MSRKARRGFEIDQSIDPLTLEVYEPGENPVKSKRSRKPGTKANKAPRALDPAKQAELDKITAEYDAKHKPKKSKGKKVAVKKARAKKMVDPMPKKSKAKKAKKEAKAPKAPKAKKAAKPLNHEGRGRATVARAEKTEGPAFEIFKLIKRPQGATLTELMSVSGWLAHSIRGFLSTATTKRGMPIIREAVKVDATGRRADKGRNQRIYKWGGEK